MLLNPSHSITFSGLPSDVLDTYVRYKQGTRAIIKWLSHHAPAETRAAYLGAKTLAINDLAKLARVASKHVQCMPDVVHFHFRETIAARNSLSSYFRRQRCGTTIDSSTVDHEYFTASLSEIYTSLCECCGEPEKYCEKTTRQARKREELPLTNQFSHLAIEDCSCSDEEDASSPISCDDCEISNITLSCTLLDTDFRLLGDTLGDSIETIAIIQHTHELYISIQEIWRQAGAGQVPLIVAAAVTNVAHVSLQELESQLRELDPAVDLPSLHLTCGLTQGHSSIEYETGPSCDDRHQMLEDMYASWRAIMHIKGCHLVPTGVACVHKPAPYLNSPDFSVKLTQGILHLAESEGAPNGVIRNGTPVHLELAGLLSHPDDSSTNLRCTFALHLLSTSYKAYMSGLECPALLSGCRLSALKLSQQAESILSAVLKDKVCFPCRCLETISYHLEELRDTLRRYTAHKCWDMFFQAPWVAGNHILEMLDMCFYYGMRLIRYRHYVGSVLHSYNVLKQLAAMEEVPLLEELCTKMAGVFFPGGQCPTSRFAASWARFVGARLKFKKGHRGHNHRESWCMTVPSHAAKRAAGLGISTDGKLRSAEDAGISVVMDLKRRDYHVDKSTWDAISSQDDIESSKRPKRRSDSVGIHNLQDLIPHLGEDMQGRLPTLRLNLFAVFETCVKIVSRISQATHTNPKGKVLRCICFATTILSGGDRIRDNEAMGTPDCWKKSNGEREVVEDAKKGIREVMLGVEEGDWLWNV